MAIKFLLKKPSSIPITKEFLEDARVKITELNLNREKVLISLQTAREMGDLSENGAYTAARFELSDTDRKLRHYQKLVRFGVVPDKNKTGTIDFGSLVTLETKNQQVSYTLVGSFEADPSKGTLSVDSPLGKLLIGKKIGDIVTLNTPAGSKNFKLISID